MQNPEEMPQETSSSSRWMMILVLVLSAAACVSAFSFFKERSMARDLSATNQALNASLSEVQNQVNELSQKLNALKFAASQRPAPVALLEAPRPRTLTARHHKKTASHRMLAVHQPPVEDPRWNQIRSQLSEHDKQLASTREEVTKTRDDLQGKLNSTRDELNGSITRSHDELNGSIATTHEELVALQKRGERNYYEFRLNKSKTFDRVGPITLSLRKVNLKHKSYNLAMMVDDSQLEKKNVNLYEPIWITFADRPQPLELVVNRVQKDLVLGYLSEPKYKKSELAATAAPR
jgi:flagellar basal body-associated protein FliL